MIKYKSYKLNNTYQMMLIGTLILLVSFGFFAQYKPIDAIGEMISIIMILVFLLYSMVKGAKFSLLHKIIISLFFLSSFFAAFREGFVFNKLYPISLFFGMAGLVYIAVKNFKTFNYRNGVGFYLILVFLINIGFVVMLFNAIRGNMDDQFEIAFFIIKFFILFLLCFISFATYIEEGKKESILFLFMTISFMFSEVMYYINTYYLPGSSFNLISKILNIIGIYFIFRYIIEVKKNKKKIN